MNSTLRIGIVGPESTGKSQLSRELAIHYGVPLVPEAARQYIDELGRPYREEDLLDIARIQARSEQNLRDTLLPILICDTTLLVVRIWSQFRYGRCHPEILKLEAESQYDLFLLCDVDLPWEPDPQREHPNLRDELLLWYYRAMLEKNTPFRLIRGTGPQRTSNAIRILTPLLEGRSEK